MQKTLGAILLLPALTLAGCATHVGVREVTPREAYRAAHTNALSAGVLRAESTVVLHRFDLLQTFDKNPEHAIAELHQQALGDTRRDILFALAEVSYIYGEQLTGRFGRENKKRAGDYFLLAAVYAYIYIADSLDNPPQDSIDRLLYPAAELYNFALWRALATGPGGALTLEQGLRRLPMGNLALRIDTSRFTWGINDFEALIPACTYAVRGFTVLNRNPGLGLPLIGLKKHVSGSIIRHQTVPATAFMRIQGRLPEFSDSAAIASIELYSTYDDARIRIGSRAVPLKIDTSTPMAYMLEHERSLWNLGLDAVKGKFMEKTSKLYLIHPYQPGRIPVVFVHGTLSSPISWSEMWNTLRSDPVVRRSVQLWFFLYNSSLPPTMTAADLRDSLNDLASTLDPSGNDPALRQMVVIGHSQGGILTKLSAVDTGDCLVDALFEKKLEDYDLPDELRHQAERALIVKPLANVRRVVFICTPHRGSFRLTPWSRKMIKMGVNLPANIIKSPAALYTFFRNDVKNLLKDKIPTSFDGMSPDNPVLTALAGIPLAPGVQGHSIIAVKDDKTLANADDGYVKYTSAHLDGMASEYIVRSDHLCLENPFVIEEVRRILLEHLQAPAETTSGTKPEAGPS